MSQEKSKLTNEVINEEGTSEDCGHGPHNCTCPPDKEYEKFTEIRSLTKLIGLIYSVPLINGFISYKPLERIWNSKKLIREIDPNWILADEVTVLEHQVLNQIDVVDINIPWDSVENKSRYLDLYKTIIRLKAIHPNWRMYLEDSKNHHFCTCLPCLEVKRRYQEALDVTSSEESNSDQENGK
jgi:hypothetical protein